MAESHCPICHTLLETRDVAPCYDCGHDPKELKHLAERRHTYAEVRIFGVNTVLCSFCQVDFSSYNPTYFGRSRGIRPGGDMVFKRDILHLHPTKDKYCPACGRRLAFLRYLAEVRATAPPETAGE